jgi:hypothetical protein
MPAGVFGTVNVTIFGEKRMRIVKLALVTGLAVFVATGSAHAITVKKRTEAPGLPPEIWQVVGGFCAIKDWHPAVASCEETKEGDVTFRTLTLKSGGKIKEKLTGTEDAAYNYEIVESPLPVKNYKSKLWLEVDDEPDRSVILWQSDFDPADGKTEEEAKKVITGILADGVKGIKKAAIDAWDKKHPGDVEKEGEDDKN